MFEFFGNAFLLESGESSNASFIHAERDKHNTDIALFVNVDIQ
jgi:hypothetical protein